MLLTTTNKKEIVYYRDEHTVLQISAANRNRLRNSLELHCSPIYTAWVAPYQNGRYQNSYPLLSRCLTYSATYGMKNLQWRAQFKAFFFCL